MRALHNCLLLSPMTQKYFSQEHLDNVKSSPSSSSSSSYYSSSATSIPLVLLSLLSLRIGPPEHSLAEQVRPTTNHSVRASLLFHPIDNYLVNSTVFTLVGYRHPRTVVSGFEIQKM
jgi:hypothetical protein